MKNIFFFIIILFFGFLNAQTISGTIKDSLSGKPLELTNITFIKSNFSVFSDINGKYKFNILDNKDVIRISNIGYDTKIVSLLKYDKNSIYNIDFNLIPRIEKLDEIIITSKKVLFTNNSHLKSENNKPQYIGFQFGTENCRFIENKQNKRGRIVSVILDLKKIKDNFRQCRLCKVDYLGTYNLKFYSYDSIHKRPGEEIYTKNIIIEPENKSYKLKIDLDSLKIKFPKEGLCVGIEIINTKYENPKKTFAIIAPSIKFFENNNISVIESWVRYRNEDWIFKPMVSRDKKAKKVVNSVIFIDVIAKYEK